MGSISIVKIKEGELAVSRDFRDLTKGEIAQFITELEVAKSRLIDLYNEES